MRCISISVGPAAGVSSLRFESVLLEVAPIALLIIVLKMVSTMMVTASRHRPIVASRAWFCGGVTSSAVECRHSPLCGLVSTPLTGGQAGQREKLGVAWNPET